MNEVKCTLPNETNLSTNDTNLHEKKYFVKKGVFFIFLEKMLTL